jgi:hypothetical protein
VEEELALMNQGTLNLDQNLEKKQLQKRPHRLSLSRLSKIAVMVKSLVYLIIRDSQAHKFSK